MAHVLDACRLFLSTGTCQKHQLVHLRNSREGKEWLCSGQASIVRSSAVTDDQLESEARVRKLRKELRLEKDMQLSTNLQSGRSGYVGDLSMLFCKARKVQTAVDPRTRSQNL